MCAGIGLFIGLSETSGIFVFLEVRFTFSPVRFLGMELPTLRLCVSPYNSIGDTIKLEGVK
jgi:hypothetical protein